MQLLLDSANLDDVIEAMKTKAFAGVTTNPSLMAKEQKNASLDPFDGYVSSLNRIANVVRTKAGHAERHLSVEVITTYHTKMVGEALKLKNGIMAGTDLHIKVPITFDTLSVISELKGYSRIKVNATCCFTSEQAKLACDAGADVVSFFYNRMKDANLNLYDEISDYRDAGGRAKIICGSIRSEYDAMECWKAGADYVTASIGIVKKMIYHQKTNEAIVSFSEDIQKWLS